MGRITNAMGTVVIYEDSPLDLESRYAALAREHEVYAFLVDDPRVGPRTEILWNASLEALARAGFTRENIVRGLPETHPTADVYFVDGMYGRCFDILQQLPKERTYVNSGSVPVLERAEREGYQIVWSKDDIPEIARRHSSA